ncbi:MAG: precorrin-8X methylmutase [Chloroflexi bacterium]|nr:precorrin-8X methylmutase [Chloroflexota bacterium]
MHHLALAPEAIEARSFEIIRQLLPDLAGDEREMQISLRIIHTSGDVGIAPYIRIHPRAVDAGLDAIRAGAPVLADVKMVAVGINAGLAQKFGCRVQCGIDAPDTVALARRNGSTRAVAAIQLFSDQLDGSIVAIGNAPTALFALLELADSTGRRPALIVGTPVGFVGAAEAKAELMGRDIPYVTIEGTRGGSAICAAAVNALLKLET